MTDLVSGPAHLVFAVALLAGLVILAVRASSGRDGWTGTGPGAR